MQLVGQSVDKAVTLLQENNIKYCLKHCSSRTGVKNADNVRVIAVHQDEGGLILLTCDFYSMVDYYNG